MKWAAVLPFLFTSPKDKEFAGAEDLIRCLVIVVLLGCVCFGPTGFVATSIAQQNQDAMRFPLQDWRPIRIEGKTIYFQNGRHFETALFRLQYIGHLPAPGRAPYLILTGRGCEPCDANLSIFVHSPEDGPMKPEHEQPRFSYPGRLLDPMTRKAVAEYRSFVGKCLLGSPLGLFWFQRHLSKDGKWVRSVFALEVEDDGSPRAPHPEPTPIAREHTRSDQGG